MKSWKNKFHGKIFLSVTKMLSEIISPRKVFKSFFLQRNIFPRTKLFLKSFSANEIFFVRQNISLRFEIFFVRRKIFLRFQNLFLVFKSSSTRFWGHESCPQNRVESYYSHSVMICRKNKLNI